MHLRAVMTDDSGWFERVKLKVDNLEENYLGLMEINCYNLIMINSIVVGSFWILSSILSMYSGCSKKFRFMVIVSNSTYSIVLNSEHSRTCNLYRFVCNCL